MENSSNKSGGSSRLTGRVIGSHKRNETWQSEVYDLAQQFEIRMFQRLAFGCQDYSSSFFNHSQSSWRSRDDGSQGSWKSRDYGNPSGGWSREQRDRDYRDLSNGWSREQRDRDYGNPSSGWGQEQRDRNTLMA
ncbi:hypothetical protein GOBAR_DD00171 [Gossypium barbadense]|nr:hypothetical protein GOBAR_DD00171 [Gossypium barbadense]